MKYPYLWSYLYSIIKSVSLSFVYLFYYFLMFCGLFMILNSLQFFYLQFKTGYYFKTRYEILKNNSLLAYSIMNNQPYLLVDFIVDIFIWPIRLYQNPQFILLFSFLYIIIFFFNSIIVLASLCLYFISTIYLCMILILFYLFHKEFKLKIKFIKIKYPQKFNIFKFWVQHVLFIPHYRMLTILYLSIFYSNNSNLISSKDLQSFIKQFCTTKWLWCFKFTFEATWLIFNVITNKNLIINQKKVSYQPSCTISNIFYLLNRGILYPLFMISDKIDK
jgi:hypothetical protein